MKIKDRGQFLETLRKMRRLNAAIIFRSVDDDLRLMLRSDTDTTDERVMAFELVIVIDHDDNRCDVMTRLMANDYLGYFEDDDDTCYVMESFEIQTESPVDAEDVTEALRKCDWLYNLRICGCAQYLVTNGEDDVCLFCQITATTTEMEKAMCPICHMDSSCISMPASKCCGVPIHRSCMEKWYEKDAAKTCPMCRGSFEGPVN
jgi:hypothetical protein